MSDVLYVKYHSFRNLELRVSWPRTVKIGAAHRNHEQEHKLQKFRKSEICTGTTKPNQNSKFSSKSDRGNQNLAPDWSCMLSKKSICKFGPIRTCPSLSFPPFSLPDMMSRKRENFLRSRMCRLRPVSNYFWRFCLMGMGACTSVFLATYSCREGDAFEKVGECRCFTGCKCGNF